jgi:hypothetical protein
VQRCAWWQAQQLTGGDEGSASGSLYPSLSNLRPLCMCLSPQGILVFCEALIIAQYAFMVPQRLGCDFISPQLQLRWARSCRSVAVCACAIRHGAHGWLHLLDVDVRHLITL